MRDQPKDNGTPVVASTIALKKPSGTGRNIGLSYSMHWLL